MNRPECIKIHEKIAESSPGAKNQGEFIYFFIPDSISRFPGPENLWKLSESSPRAENQGEFMYFFIPDSISTFPGSENH